MTAPIRYARAGNVHVAYQIVGNGPMDIVFVPEFWHSIDGQWEEPSFARFLTRLSSFSRLICYDKRGTGRSDPIHVGDGTRMEEWVEDLVAIADAIGSKRQVLLTSGAGAMVGIAFATRYPERIAQLIIYNGFARFVRGEGYPWGFRMPDPILKDMDAHWGEGILLDLLAPSQTDDPRFEEWWARYQTLGARPSSAIELRQIIYRTDMRDALPDVRVPTLILDRPNKWIESEHSKYLADHIEGARYASLSGGDYFIFLGDMDETLGEIQEFLTGSRNVVYTDTVLATLMFTDMVNSTEQASAMGDRRWRAMLDAHDEIVSSELERFNGTPWKYTGDGILATFDRPLRAIHCARAICAKSTSIGAEIRAALHAGEIEIRGEDLGGIAVHIGARILSHARPSEVLCSSTVRDLVTGSNIEFEDRGWHKLRGVPGRWHLVSVPQK